MADDLLDRVRRRLADSGDEPTPARVAAALRAEGGLAGVAGDTLDTLRRLQDELLGAGPLAPLLREPDVTDVLVNAPDDVWVDRGGGLERAGVRFADDEAVRRLVHRLLAPTGRRLDTARPWADARLPDGTRLHAVLPPIARSTCVSLRTSRRRAFTLPELLERGSVTPLLAAWLRAVVAARLPVVVSGGTGTGKTTVLACLLGLADPADRIVVVEDAAELRPDRPHVVCLEARPPNVEGAGEVALRDLVRQALRMRPDRLVVGEVRGAEVVDMLAAFNTGHEGGMTTVHANAAADVPVRIEALAAAAGLGRDAAHASMAAALGVVVHLERRGGVRSVREIAVTERGRGGLVTTVPAVRTDGPATALPRLADLVTGRGIDPPAPS